MATQQALFLGEAKSFFYKNATGGALTVGNVVAPGKILGVLQSTSGLASNSANTTLTSLANGDTGVVDVVGNFRLPKKITTDAWVEGAKLYWDATNGWVTNTPNGNYLGVATKLQVAADAICEVALNIDSQGVDGSDLIVHGDGLHSVPFLIEKSWPDQATADVAIYNANAPFPFRVIDTLLENQAANGANANTIQVCKAAAGGSPITDAMSLNGKAAKDLVRALTIDTAMAQITKGGSLFLRQTKAGGVMGGIARIWAVRE